MFIILLVLGSLYTGMATPTEAAGMGALGSLIASAINRRLTRQRVWDALYGCLGTAAMAMWIVIAAYCFCSIYSSSGAKDLVVQVIAKLPVNRWVVLTGMQLVLFVLGMFLDPVGIVMVATPVFHPIVIALGFNPLWFGILFTMNLEMAHLTPPLGFNLFFLKGVAPEGITLTDIYRSVEPFVVLQAIGLTLVMIFPQIALYLPSTM